MKPTFAKLVALGKLVTVCIGSSAFYYLKPSRYIVIIYVRISDLLVDNWMFISHSITHTIVVLSVVLYNTMYSM